MANASELLHFVSQDTDIRLCSTDAQNMLADCVQLAFFSLFDCLQERLHNVMYVFFDHSNNEKTLQGNNSSMVTSHVSE